MDNLQRDIFSFSAPSLNMHSWALSLAVAPKLTSQVLILVKSSRTESSSP